MKVNEIVKLVGNFNRVREMKKAGVGDKTIAASFEEQNMKITANDVKIVCKIDKVFTTKSYPKKMVKNVIKAKEIVAEIAEEIRSNENIR